MSTFAEGSRLQPRRWPLMMHSRSQSVPWLNARRPWKRQQMLHEQEPRLLHRLDLPLRVPALDAAVYGWTFGRWWSDHVMSMSFSHYLVCKKYSRQHIMSKVLISLTEYRNWLGKCSSHISWGYSCTHTEPRGSWLSCPMGAECTFQPWPLMDLATGLCAVTQVAKKFWPRAMGSSIGSMLLISSAQDREAGRHCCPTNFPAQLSELVASYANHSSDSVNQIINHSLGTLV